MTGLPRFVAGAVVILMALSVSRSATMAASALDAIPNDVVGVIGSGDQLSLIIRSDVGQRILKTGEIYSNGWVLQSLTNSEAVFSKNGQSNVINLSPYGGLDKIGADKEKETIVTVVNGDDQESFSATWDGKTPKRGLTLEETRLYVQDQQIAQGIWRNRLATAEPIVDGPLARIELSYSDLLREMGPEGAEFANLDMKIKLANYATDLAAYNSALARFGPTKLYIPNGSNVGAALASAGLTGASMRPGASDQGGVTYVLAPPVEPTPMGEPVVGNGATITLMYAVNISFVK